MHTILQAPQRQPDAPLQSWDRPTRLATYSLRYSSDIYISIVCANQLSQGQLNQAGYRRKKQDEMSGGYE